MVLSYIKRRLYGEHYDRYLLYSSYEMLPGPEIHIGDHVIRKVKVKSYSDYTGPETKWVCWLCEESKSKKADFEGIDCHDCDCRFCPKRKR